MNKTGINIDKVSFSYDNKHKELDNISVAIPKGSFCGVTGTNGSGKTTLTLLLNGLIPHQVIGHYSGNTYIDGMNTRDKSVSFFSQHVGLVFQNPDFMIFNLTVYDEIAFGLLNLGKKNFDGKIKSSLEIVGLTGYEKRDPHSLSFGQKQKLCLAIVLAMETDYIVLDEPSAMLDYKSSLHLYGILASLHKSGKTIVIVEHDTDFLYTYANQIIILEQGSIITQGNSEKVFSQKNKLENLGIKIPRKI